VVGGFSARPPGGGTAGWKASHHREIGLIYFRDSDGAMPRIGAMLEIALPGASGHPRTAQLMQEGDSSIPPTDEWQAEDHAVPIVKE